MRTRGASTGRALIDAINAALGKGGSTEPPFPQRPGSTEHNLSDPDPGPPVVGMTDEQLKSARARSCAATACSNPTPKEGDGHEAR
jgi:hypothetical protein